MTTLPLVQAPDPSFRLIASRFPPIDAFSTVASSTDLEAVMELEGWTNDRLVAERVARLPRAEWVFGVPNASVVMAAFLHAAPEGGRFSGPHLGAWYAGGSIATAVAEVAHHLRRESVARGTSEMRRVFRCYAARLQGDDFLDLRGRQQTHPDLYSGTSHDASQAFGENVRASARSGILYDSVRYRNGANIVAYRPRQITEVRQTDHYDLLVPVRGRIIARRLQEAG